MSSPYHMPVLDVPLVAAADLSAKQYYIIEMSGANVNVCGDGEAGIGVLQNAPESGQAASVRVLGVTPVILGGTVASGALVASDTNGKAVTAGAGDTIVGVMLVGGSASEYGTLLLMAAPAHKSVVPFCFTFDLANIADGDIITTFVPGFNGKISKIYAVCTKAVTTGSKASTLNAEIGTTNTTGGVLSLTSANLTPIGAVVAATAITAANVFSATDTVSIEASSTTAFVEGQITLVVQCEEV